MLRGLKDLRIALVHDDLIQRGGAERLFEAMMEIWPEADVFTSMISDRSPSGLDDAESTRRVEKSFMQRLPFKEKLYRHYFPLYPLAFESLGLTDYDIVVSSSTRFAHGVITRPETLHICYMNTPGRMIWEPFDYFGGSLEERSPSALRALLLSPLLSWLRLWDYQAAQRVDCFIANSKTPQKRIKKYYGRDSHIIYPFVELERFKASAKCKARSAKLSSKLKAEETEGHYLIVSRLTAWKKIDIAIEACNELRLPLKIVGEGSDGGRLKKLAGSTIDFLGRLSDKEVVEYCRGCKALVFPQREDFGIAPLEAMAAGRPVLAFGAGGALETVIAGKTGEFFYPQTTAALVKALKRFDPARYAAADCRAQAEKFSKERFKKGLKSFVARAYDKHRRSLRFL